MTLFEIFPILTHAKSMIIKVVVGLALKTHFLSYNIRISRTPQIQIQRIENISQLISNFSNLE